MEFLEIDTDRIAVDPETGCYRWLGSHSAGYGIIEYRETTLYAHVLSYLLFHGPVLKNHEVDHIHAVGCRYKDCINPFHLESVLHSENMRRIRRSPELGKHYTLPDVDPNDLL